RLRPKTYVRSVRPRDTVVPGFDSDMATIEEGYSMQVSPLFSLDGRSVDLAIKCHVDQVEKLVPVAVDLPGFGGQWQRTQVQVPQVVSWRLNERFRWPTDQVLLLSCGVVANPAAEAKPAGLGLMGQLMSNTGRADALVFVDCQGKPLTGGATVEPPKSTATNGPSYRGRY
ncbi:MAG TPA: hypothetical protein PLV92_10690, partial [Pirellulaceae bacterium]|nr:hypothetical protein [Pirellulaceae bacterium]